MSSPVSPDDEPRKPPEPPWREFARAPLVPVAVAATCGLIADRYGDVPALAGWVVGLGGLVAWGVGRSRNAAAAEVWLWVAAAGLAAAHLHAHLHSFPPDDIGTFATEVPTPARVWGALGEEPTHFRPLRPDPLVTEQKGETTSTVLVATAIETRDGKTPASGRVRLTVEGRLDGLHAGDAVEVTGRLALPHGPANPGERDFRAALLDLRITATLRVEKSAAGITRLDDGWRTSVFGWLGVVRGWGTRALRQSLPPDESGLAAALLLGDTAALDRGEWDAYVRTGVVHVLAISGQHLVVLAAFVWFVLEAFDVRRRHGAWVVMGVMIGYTLLTGARPSAVRATAMVCCLCLAVVLRRPVVRANAFALAWLVVIALNPADPFTAGCQLSFLSVFVLVWGLGRLLAPRPPTPVEQLIEESRSESVKLARAAVRFVGVMFLISLILGVVNAPLLLAWQNIVSPIGIVLGPPLVLLTSIALVSGFLLLLAFPFGVVAWPFAFVTEWSLRGCEVLVHAAERIPGGWVYGPSPAAGWLVGFYLAVAGAVLLPQPWSRRCLAGLVVWVLVGLLASERPRPSDECRVTFLAVGHGGCVVIEAPDGRVLLYDAGTTAGPDVVRRVVAPFLWHRGITRIDEVFLSHADLDHFNGVPELLKRFPVGRVTLTPTFGDKGTPGVEAVLTAIDRRGVERRVVAAGERFSAGEVSFEVLHPPMEGPAGNENARSMVLLMRYGEARVLLTGDLEGDGLAWVRDRPVPPVDVMLAPHHGSKASNFPLRGPAGDPLPGPMATWAKPKLVISSQRPGSTDHLGPAYRGVGAIVWDTPNAGAVTVRCHRTGVVAEGFRSREVRVVGRGR